jgi:hypothetical protein
MKISIFYTYARLRKKTFYIDMHEASIMTSDVVILGIIIFKFF